ncbi:MAG: cupin domain-containing protein [Pseudonocardiaceae bacterium]
MDALAGLLEGPRARDAFVLRSMQDPPWSVRVQDKAPLSIVAIVRGDPWVVPDRGDAVRLHPEDVAIMRGPDSYTFTDGSAGHTDRISGRPVRQSLRGTYKG